MLYTPEGKPRVAIFSIAHLADEERMFFVTLLLNHVVSWMRAQSGTSSLRAMLYMDEVAGYLPPVANPPSKQALLMLMKQARAFGLGVVLATQNPVDIDYKGLSNAGTWFLGRLQTERDKARLLDGLEGALQRAGRDVRSRRDGAHPVVAAEADVLPAQRARGRPGDLPDALGDVVPARTADEGSDQAADAEGRAGSGRLPGAATGAAGPTPGGGFQRLRRCRSGARAAARAVAAADAPRRRRSCRRRSSSSSRRPSRA